MKTGYIPPVEACDSQTPSLVPCVHCCGRSPQPEWATHSLFYLLQPRCVESSALEPYSRSESPRQATSLLSLISSIAATSSGNFTAMRRCFGTHYYCEWTVQCRTETAALRSSSIKNSQGWVAKHWLTQCGATCQKAINHQDSGLSALSLILIGGGKTELWSIKNLTWTFMLFFSPLIRC